MNYKIVNIEISNVRNIKNGRIKFSNQEGQINTVTGIYGQNASGKSSVIKAIAYLQKIIDFRYQLEDFESLIHFDSDEAMINIEIEYNGSLIDYTIYFIRTEGSVQFSREQLIFDKVLLFDVDHLQKTVIENKLVDNQYQVELMVMSEIAFETGKSYFGSKYAFEKLYTNRISNYHQAVEAIYMLSTKINIISDHDSSSNNIDDNLVIFDLNQDGIDDLTIDLDNNGLVSKVLFQSLEKQFINLNSVISTIVPTVSLKVEVEERGDELLKLSYYTKRKGVDSLIPLAEESYGIKKIISLAFSLIQVMNKPDFILIVDELDAGIFEYLLGQLVEVIDNYAQGQLIFTSHNLRAVEVLNPDSVVFTTSNLNNCFIKIPKHEQLDNMRDTYYRSIILEGTAEDLYNKTFDNDILMGLMDYE